MAAPETRKSGRSASPSGKLLESIANDDAPAPPSGGEKQGPSKKLSASSSAGSGVGSGTTPPPSPPLLPQASGEGKTEISMATLLAAITSLKEATELSQRTAHAAAQDAAEARKPRVQHCSQAPHRLPGPGGVQVAAEADQRIAFALQRGRPAQPPILASAQSYVLLFYRLILQRMLRFMCSKESV